MSAVLQQKKQIPLQEHVAEISAFLDSCRYDHAAIQEDGCLYRTPYEILRDHACVCLDGALFAAEFLIPEQHYVGGVHGLLFLNSTNTKGKSYGHAVYVYKEEERFGAIGKSSHPLLTHRALEYRSIEHLTQSYVDVLEGDLLRDSITFAHVDLPHVGLSRKQRWEWKQRLQEFLLEIEYKQWY